jgi:hypothetical protein
MVELDSPVACLDQQTNVGVHERHRHSDILAVGKDSTPLCPALFDEAEDVIPPADDKSADPGLIRTYPDPTFHN